MRIREIYVEGFGKLSKMRLTLSDGLNVLKRENGFGKTTLTVFIKAMLYGLERSKKQSVTENDRRHYLPWSGGKCGGSLTFEMGGRAYRIERTFAERAQNDTFKLYDLTTGKESHAFGERLGEELFGIDEDGFLRTVFLSEENLGGKNDNKTVAAKLTSLIGCDGDISSLDKALLALDEERKIYYKRGGGGEIRDLQRRAAELDADIAERERLTCELRDSERELTLLLARIDEANKKRESERERAAAVGRERVRRVYAKQYIEMRKTLEEDTERLRELNGFFKGGIPTATELMDMREKMSEAAVLGRQSELDRTAGADFGGGVSEEEYARAGELSERLTRLEGEISALESAPEESGFVSDIPPLSEIEKAKDGIKKRRTLSAFLPISVLLGATAALLGSVLEPMLYALMIPALMLFVIGITRTFSARRSAASRRERAMLLIERVTGRRCEGERLYEMLLELQRMAEAAEARRADSGIRAERIAALKREAEAVTVEAEAFIRGFEGISGGSVQSRINEIFVKRRASVALSYELDARRRAARAAGLRIEELKGEISAFLSAFNTVSERPLDEIASRLTERESLMRSLDRTRESVDAFREEHGITDADLALAKEELPTPAADTQVYDGEASRLEAEKALIERRCSEISARLAALDGVSDEQSALLSRRAEYEKRLRMITKARELLLRASDSLTSKYLSRTKEAFIGYVNMMRRELSGDFSLSTSFEIMKSEEGEYREAEAYSRGERDMLSLAMRLALIDTLYEGERPFIILDDPFAHLDDTALRNAKAIIKAVARDKQIIYLTCADSRNI